MFQADTPSPLFQTRIVNTGRRDDRGQYAVSPDGRFLINQSTDESGNAPITLILNWKPKSR
jgi:hypothetical protein